MRYIMILAAASAACGGPGGRDRIDDPSLRGPTVVALDSITLEEHDSLALGEQVNLLRGPGGTLFIGDGDRGRIIQYDHTGRLMGVIGRKGEGPGELGDAGVMGLLQGDTLLAVSDGQERAISVFTLAGHFVRRVPTPFISASPGWNRTGDTVTLGIPFESRFIARWALSSDSIVLLAPAPERLQAAGLFYLMYGRPMVVPVAEGYLAQIPTEPGLQIFGGEGQLLRRIGFPAVRRRGTPEGVLDRHLKLAEQRAPMQYLASLPMGIRRLSDSSFAVLQLDLDVQEKRQYGNFRFFVSLFAPDLSRACLDAPLPPQPDAVSIPIFSGDTLLILNHTITADNRVENRLHSYLIRPDGCDWVPIGPR